MLTCVTEGEWYLSILLNSVVTTIYDLNVLLWLLVDALDLFNHVEGSKSTDDSSKDNGVVVHEAEWATGSDIELALVSVGISISSAHAEHTWLVMLHGEAFICELALFIDRELLQGFIRF